MKSEPPVRVAFFRPDKSTSSRYGISLFYCSYGNCKFEFHSEAAENELKPVQIISHIVQSPLQLNGLTRDSPHQPATS